MTATTIAPKKTAGFFMRNTPCREKSTGTNMLACFGSLCLSNNFYTIALLYSSFRLRDEHTNHTGNQQNHSNTKSSIATYMMRIGVCSSRKKISTYSKSNNSKCNYRVINHWVFHDTS